MDCMGRWATGCWTVFLVLGCGSEGGMEGGFGDDAETVLRVQIRPTFEDATAESGIGLNTGNGIWPGHGSWGGVWADVDEDGHLDLLT